LRKKNNPRAKQISLLSMAEHEFSIEHLRELTELSPARQEQIARERAILVEFEEFFQKELYGRMCEAAKKNITSTTISYDELDKLRIVEKALRKKGYRTKSYPANHSGYCRDYRLDLSWEID